MSKRKSATPKMTLIVLLTISAVLLLLLGIWLVGELKDTFRDPPAVTTPSPDVSTPFAGSSEVEMLIESYVKDMRKDQTMTVSAGGASVKLSLNEANAPFDYDELTAYMKSKGYDLSLIKQYQKLFRMDGIELTFEDAALDAIATLAEKRKTGARGLRAITEEIMTKLMFDAPSEGIKKLTVTADMLRA